MSLPYKSSSSGLQRRVWNNFRVLWRTSIIVGLWKKKKKWPNVFSLAKLRPCSEDIPPAGGGVLQRLLHRSGGQNADAASDLKVILSVSCAHCWVPKESAQSFSAETETWLWNSIPCQFLCSFPLALMTEMPRVICGTGYASCARQLLCLLAPYQSNILIFLASSE